MLRNVSLDGVTEDALPKPCPLCNGPGYLEVVDVVHAVKHEACRRCGHRWDTHFGTPQAAVASRPLGSNSTRTNLSERIAMSRRASA